VLDRHWNIVTANAAMGRVLGLFMSADEAAAAGAPNVMRLTYHPRGLRAWIVNWAETASAYVQWLHRDLLRTGDEKTRALLDELLAYPGIPREWLAIDLDALTEPVPGDGVPQGRRALQLLHHYREPGYPVRRHAARAAGGELLSGRRRDRLGAPRSCGSVARIGQRFVSPDFTVRKRRISPASWR
jgi:hypothetical protein